MTNELASPPPQSKTQQLRAAAARVGAPTALLEQVARTQPHRVQLGSLILLSVDGLAEEWGVSEESFLGLLKALGHIPILTPPGGTRRYVSLYPLEYALFEIGLPMAMKSTGTSPYTKDETLVNVHFQLAGLLYGTLTRDAIRERVKALARTLGKELTLATKAPKKGKRSLPPFNEKPIIEMGKEE